MQRAVGPVLVRVPLLVPVDVDLAYDGSIGMVWVWLVVPAMGFAYELHQEKKLLKRKGDCYCIAFFTFIRCSGGITCMLWADSI